MTSLTSVTFLRGLISTQEFRASTYELREGYRYSVHNNILIKQCLAPQQEDLHWYGLFIPDLTSLPHRSTLEVLIFLAAKSADL